MKLAARIYKVVKNQGDDGISGKDVAEILKDFMPAEEFPNPGFSVSQLLRYMQVKSDKVYNRKGKWYATGLGPGPETTSEQKPQSPLQSPTTNVPQITEEPVESDEEQWRGETVEITFEGFAYEHVIELAKLARVPHSDWEPVTLFTPLKIYVTPNPAKYTAKSSRFIVWKNVQALRVLREGDQEETVAIPEGFSVVVRPMKAK